MPSPQSPFAWPGGKRALKKTLLGLVPPHRVYVEVFAGSAKLLFAKEPSPREILNDLNGEVTNFFRVAKHRPAALAEMFERETIHAGRFRELLAADSHDELERALRFAYLAWYSYGSKGQHFASSSARTAPGASGVHSIASTSCSPRRPVVCATC
jgi:DNA adenine methylase